MGSFIQSSQGVNRTPFITLLFFCCFFSVIWILAKNMTASVLGLCPSRFTSRKKERKSLPPKLKQKPRNWVSYCLHLDLTSTSELRTVARHRQSTRFLGLEKLIHPEAWRPSLWKKNTQELVIRRQECIREWTPGSRSQGLRVICKNSKIPAYIHYKRQQMLHIEYFSLGRWNHHSPSHEVMWSMNTVV